MTSDILYGIGLARQAIIDECKDQMTLNEAMLLHQCLNNLEEKVNGVIESRIAGGSSLSNSTLKQWPTINLETVLPKRKLILVVNNN